MKLKYESPTFDAVDVELKDCLAVSESLVPENPIPDVTIPGGDNFEW